jgi:hypothetical protein
MNRIGLKKTGLLLVSIGLGLMFGCDQSQIEDNPEVRKEIASEIARLEIESGTYDEMLDDGAQVALDASLDRLKLDMKRELTPGEEKKVHEIYRQALQETLTREEWETILLETYSDRLKAAELDVLLGFLSSEEGRSILSAQKEIDDELADKAGDLIEADLDSFGQRVDEALAKAFGTTDSSEGSQ